MPDSGTRPSRIALGQRARVPLPHQPSLARHASEVHWASQSGEGRPRRFISARRLDPHRQRPRSWHGHARGDSENHPGSVSSDEVCSRRRSRGSSIGQRRPTVSNYREELARTLQSLPAAGFERFCQRLLRESGFQEVTITGRSGDGGIDGIGILASQLVGQFQGSVPLQKVRRSVAPSHVRDFRGAMTGRADKGIIMTTGVNHLGCPQRGRSGRRTTYRACRWRKLTTMLEQLELGLKPRQTFELDATFPNTGSRARPGCDAD